MIEVRIIDFVMNKSGKAETEALVASMMMDNWTIQSFQVTDSGGDLLQSGVFVMVRDVEPVVAAVDDGHLRNMCVLFNLLSQNHIIGALRPGYLWQVQLGALKLAKWLQQHEPAASNGSIFGDNIREYIATHDVETGGELDGMREYARRIHAEYLKQQEEDGEQ